MGNLLRYEESGQGAAEYLLIISLIALASIAAFKLLGTKMSAHGNSIVSKVRIGFGDKE